MQKQFTYTFDSIKPNASALGLSYGVEDLEEGRRRVM
jgi:hypothetical protein